MGTTPLNVQTSSPPVENYSDTWTDIPSTGGGLVRHMGRHPVFEWRVTLRNGRTPSSRVEGRSATRADTPAPWNDPLEIRDLRAERR